MCSKHKSLIDRKMNIETIEYDLLSNRFGITQSEIDSIDPGTGRINLDRLFNGNRSAF